MTDQFNERGGYYSHPGNCAHSPDLKCAVCGSGYPDGFRQQTHPTIPVTVSEFDGDQTSRYKAGDVVETSDTGGKVVNAMWEEMERQKACLRGEHDGEANDFQYEMRIVPPYSFKANIETAKAKVCRHCRCLFVPKEKS